MFVTGPPQAAGRAVGVPHLTWARHLSFGARGRQIATDQGFRRAMLRYLADMLEPFGIAYLEECFESGNQNCYAYLAEQLLGCLPEPGSPQRCGPGLVVIAHATADCEPGRSLSGYLTTLLPEEPLCFAISDQRDLAPFSALEVVRGFMSAGWPTGALVLVLDQSTLPYTGRTERAYPPADHAVGLMFGADPAAASRPLAAIRQRSGIVPGQLAAALAELLADLPPPELPPDQVSVIAGTGLLARCEPEQLARLAAAGQVRAARAGAPCVGPWTLLAGAGASGTGRVLVIEYDPELAAAGLVAFDPAVRADQVTPAVEVSA